jgi:chemotaxis protein MotD
VFSVTPEPALSASASAQRARQPRGGQSSSDDFGSLLDANAATASGADRATAQAAPAGNTPTPPAEVKSQAKTSDARAADAETDGTSDDDATPAASPAADALPQPVAVVIVPAVTVAGQAAAPTTTATSGVTTTAATDATVAQAVLQAQATTAEPSATQADAAIPAALPAKAKTAAGVATLAATAEDATETTDAPPTVATDEAAKAAPPAPDDGTSAVAGDKATAPQTTGNAAAAEPARETAKETAKAQPSETHHASVGAAPDSLTQPDPAAQLAATLSPQASAQSATAAVQTPQLNVALATGTPVPLSGLAVDIALRAAGGNSRFEIRLDPAELGRIDVRLEVDKHGNVTSHLTVERPATLDMLRNDAPKLQQALQDAGLKTGDGGLQFSLRDQSSSGQDGKPGDGRHARRLVISEDDTVPAQVAGRSYGRRLGASSGVDIRI